MLDNNSSLKELIDAFQIVDSDLIDRGGAQSITPSSSNRILPRGNYRGDITVKGDVNLIASNILSGKSIFGVNGSVIEGKQFASGVAPSKTGNKYFYSYDGQQHADSDYITINLSFTPRVIILYGKASSGYDGICVYGSFGYRYTNKACKVANFHDLLDLSTMNRMYRYNEIEVGSNVFHMPSKSLYYPINWIAYA